MILRSHGQWIPAGRAGETVLLALLVASGGCSGNLTAGGLTGEATVVVSGDAQDEQGAPSQHATALAGAPARTTVSSDPEGEVEVEFLIFLESAGGDVVPLTDDEIRVRVDVRGRREADVASRTVPATVYTGLRIVFTEIKAEIDSGLVIDGQPVVGDIEVELENTTLTVTRPLSLTIDDGERVELLVELNATDWLLAVDPDLRNVAETVFATALSVVVR